VKRLLSLLTAGALAVTLAAGCSKSSSSESASAAPSGPITDSAEDGLKPTEAPSGAIGDVAHGNAVFAQNCAGCHGAGGLSGGVGPSLKNEKSRKDLAATVAWIKNPQPPMPKLWPSTINDKDLADVAAYVQSL
jgi:mono/diheme cytochrome c family protein